MRFIIDTAQNMWTARWTGINKQQPKNKHYKETGEGQIVDRAFLSTSKGMHQWRFHPLMEFLNTG